MLSVAPLAASLLLAPLVVERLDLPKMVEKSDAAVAGTIVDVTASEATVGGVTHVFTHLRVRGENLFTGREDEVVVSFLGGQSGRLEQWSSVAPARAEIRTGARVVVFSKWSPAMAGTGLHSLVAAHGGLFRVEAGPRGDVVVGRGDGYALDRSLRLDDLRRRIAAIRDAISRRGAKAS